MGCFGRLGYRYLVVLIDLRLLIANSCLPPHRNFIYLWCYFPVLRCTCFSLFDDVGTTLVATLRVIGAAIILILLRRIWRRSMEELDLAWTALFGIVLAGMNLLYLAIDNLPLGNAVAIEF